MSANHLFDCEAQVRCHTYPAVLRKVCVLGHPFAFFTVERDVKRQKKKAGGEVERNNSGYPQVG